MSNQYLPASERVLTRDAVKERCRELRQQGHTIVFTNGCFDILHLGHVRYLEAAAELGDRLVVGVNADSSVRRLKGSARPILPEYDRAHLVAALRSVDLVTIFEEDTPYELIAAIRPYILVKGGDYDPDARDGPRYIVGSDVVRAEGGSVVVMPMVEGRSTTNVVERVLQAHSE